MTSDRNRTPLCCALACCLLAAGCEKKSDPAAEAPPQAQVIQAPNSDLVKVDHPEQFPVVKATAYRAASSLNVTGSVTPDVARTIPVVALASGRVVAIEAKVGDFVKKGQLLMQIASDDISGAYSTYRKAVADEVLAKVQLERAKLLFDQGAYPRSQLEIAQDTEDKALVDVETALEHLKLIGVKDPNGPQVQTVNVYAPATGVIIAQNVTEAAPAINALNGTPNLFTIADLSHVWIVCDVYENDLAQVHTGQAADIRLNAYPDRVLHGNISEIDAILDPNLRAGKVRIQVENPDYFMRIGMFATATFHGKALENHASVPANAVIHLHDRAWVYEPMHAPNGASGQYKRIAVETGATLPDKMVEVVSGVQPGDPVVTNALALQNTVEQ